MSSWHDLLQELKVLGSTHDIVRRKALKRLSRISGRNTIIYYSGWLQKPGAPSLQVSDSDKNGFMAAIHGLDREKELDLVLHTPGGETAATESLVDYLHSMFGDNIRAIVPQLALSAGTMIACACKEIVMGKHSSLGPIDPQLGGLPAHGVVEEFKRAHAEISQDKTRIPLWQPIIAKYRPTLIGECEKAIEWSNEMVRDWLQKVMFKGRRAGAKAANITKELSDHALTKSHARHLSADKCRSIGLKVDMLENDQKFQEAVLTVHHACIHTLWGTQAVKIIENQKGVAFIELAPVTVKGPGPKQAPPVLEFPPGKPDSEEKEIGPEPGVPFGEQVAPPQRLVKGRFSPLKPTLKALSFPVSSGHFSRPTCPLTVSFKHHFPGVGTLDNSLPKSIVANFPMGDGMLLPAN